MDAVMSVVLPAVAARDLVQVLFPSGLDDFQIHIISTVFFSNV